MEYQVLFRYLKQCTPYGYVATLYGFTIAQLGQDRTSTPYFSTAALPNDDRDQFRVVAGDSLAWPRPYRAAGAYPDLLQCHALNGPVPLPFLLPSFPMQSGGLVEFVSESVSALRDRANRARRR